MTHACNHLGCVSRRGSRHRRARGRSGYMADRHDIMPLIGVDDALVKIDRRSKQVEGADRNRWRNSQCKIDGWNVRVAADYDRHRQRAFDIVGAVILGKHLDQRGLPGIRRNYRNRSRNESGHHREFAVRECNATVGTAGAAALLVGSIARLDLDEQRVVARSRDFHHIGVGTFRQYRNVLERRRSRDRARQREEARVVGIRGRDTDALIRGSNAKVWRWRRIHFALGSGGISNCSVAPTMFLFGVQASRTVPVTLPSARLPVMVTVGSRVDSSSRK